MEKPLRGIFPQNFIERDIYLIASEGELLSPTNLKAELFFKYFKQRIFEQENFQLDLIRPAEPLNSLPWLEGILGMDIRVTGQAIWAEPLLEKREEIKNFNPILNEKWLETTLTFVSDLVREFSPLYPIAGPFLRGPADIVAAMIGTDRFCLEIMDHPGEISRLMKFCAQAWVEVISEVIKRIPIWNGGYIPGARWVWAPGECVYFSEDTTVLLSPKQYKEIILPFNLWMASKIPYGFVHRHSASLHNIHHLLDLPSGWAIEVTMDPSGPSFEKMLPVLLEIQAAHRSLIIFYPRSLFPVESFLEGLSPHQLCLIEYSEKVDPVFQPDEFKRWKKNYAKVL
ncbi:MAG: hypothetical protein JEZ06_03560 [Anaerolineaceae bacterium]|nr:hypothetical protein [Anaerolineaceae bacterium]